MEAQRNRIYDIERTIVNEKRIYSDAMNNLRIISDEVSEPVISYFKALTYGYRLNFVPNPLCHEFIEYYSILDTFESTNKKITP